MSDCPRSYPDFTEVGPCIVGLVNDVRAVMAGEEVDVPHAVQRGWNVQGAALKATFGEAHPTVGESGEDLIQGPEHACEVLESAVPPENVKSVQSIPWPLVLAAAQFLLDFLRRRKDPQ